MAADSYTIFEAPTKPTAEALIQHSGILNAQNPVIFDSACGSGTVTACLLLTPQFKEIRPNILAGDISENQVKTCTERGEKAGWTGVEYKVVDAQVGCHVYVERGSNTILRIQNWPLITSLISL